MLLRNAVVLALHAFAWVAGFIAGSSMPLEAAQRRGAWKAIALFLPLAAWLVASRRGEWGNLLAPTFVTVAIAAPTLVATALVETYVTPALIRMAIGG